MSECEAREVDRAQLDVSVVVPLANERETLEELCSQIAAVLAQEERCFEVIFVDDGSADGSWEVIRRLHAAHENVRGIRFRRNFRKAAALAAGFAHARGAIVVTIDADLQDDPRSIVALLRKIDRKSTRLNSSHQIISYAVFCLKKKKKNNKKN